MQIISTSYHPNLLSLLVPPKTVGSLIPGANWPPYLTDGEDEQLRQITNAFRTTHGGGPALEFEADLMASARYQAQRLAMYSFLAHDDPAEPQDNLPALSIVERFAYFYGTARAWAENAAWAQRTPQEVFNAFISAGPGEGHYDNIVNPTWTACGFAVASGNGLKFWVQEFGTLVPSGPAPTIVSMSPSSGSVGQTITVFGTGFDTVSQTEFAPAGGGKMIEATFTKISSTQLTTVVPVGAGTGPFLVQNKGGLALNNFTVTSQPPPPPPPPPPVIVKIGSLWRNKTTGKIVTIIAVAGNSVQWKRGTTVRTIALKTLLHNFTISG